MLIRPAIAEAPANQRIRMLLMSYNRAERIAEVLVGEVGERTAVGLRRPVSNWSAGMSSVVTRLLEIR